MKTRKVLFLYTELAEYFLACLRALVQEGCEVHVVRWKVNQEAPFEFSASDSIEFYPRDSYTDEQLVLQVDDIQPDLIVCSGWVDKGYLKVCRKWNGQVPTVMTMDNHWNGSLKQTVATLLAPMYFKGRFSHAWVPGDPQYKYARKLGFSSKNILRGFYSADFEHFHQMAESFEEARNERIPHRMIYLGRYVQHKGIFEMWEAFKQLRQQSEDWELWCIGTGDQYDNRIEAEGIRHFGFVQPRDLADILKDTGVFVLPSHFEPWGVVVHEMAAAGFPMICSREVGAATAFVKEGENGELFDAEDVEDMKKAMLSITSRTDDQLRHMGQRSRELAGQITPESWSQTILSVLN